MKKTKIYCIIFLSVLSTFLAFAQKYDASLCKKTVKVLCDEKMQGRKAGTEGEKLSARFIHRKFKKMGIDCSLQFFTHQQIQESLPEHAVTKPYTSLINVIGQIKGKDTTQCIILGAHYDHLGVVDGELYPGADDNASGVAALLGVGKMLSQMKEKPEKTIILCAFSGEEMRMLGSESFLHHWEKDAKNKDKKIALYINMDMVGRTSTPHSPKIGFAYNADYDSLKNDADTANKDPKTKEKLIEFIYSPRHGDGRGGSDYVPFSRRKIAFMAFMEDAEHDDYHKSSDTIDKLHFGKIKSMTILSFNIIKNAAF